jgi:hypothetical protein
MFGSHTCISQVGAARADSGTIKIGGSGYVYVANKRTRWSYIRQGSVLKDISGPPINLPRLTEALKKRP